MQYNTISSDMDMQTLSSISNVMFELGTGVNTTSFSFKTNGVSRTNCVTNCNSKFITTFYTSEALVIYRGADMFISNPSTNLLNAMTLHGVVADKNHIQANSPSAMSPIQIVTNVTPEEEMEGEPFSFSTALNGSQRLSTALNGYQRLSTAINGSNGRLVFFCVYDGNVNND